MVDADSRDSHDDCAYADKGQHFESIGSLKQHDVGQMLFLKQRPLLDKQRGHTEKVAGERHGVMEV